MGFTKLKLKATKVKSKDVQAMMPKTAVQYWNHYVI